MPHHTVCKKITLHSYNSDMVTTGAAQRALRLLQTDGERRRDADLIRWLVPFPESCVAEQAANR